jgi:hypothetical protein
VKKCFAILAAFALTTIAAQSQSIIANWTFEPDPLPVNITNSAVGPFSPALGAGSVTGLHAVANTAWFSTVGNGSSDSLGGNNWTTGDYFQFQFSTLTFSNIGMTWSQTRGASGPTNFSLSYSTDGAAFTTFTSCFGFHGRFGDSYVDQQPSKRLFPSGFRADRSRRWHGPH